MLISDYITPVMYLDPSGEAWWHWGVAIGTVAILAALTVISCGGFAAAYGAIILAGNGIALTGLSTGATILAFATAGSALGLASSAIYAGLSSSSLDEFASYGSSGLFMTITGGVLGAYAGYKSYQAGLHTQGTYSTPKESRPNSSYTQYDSKGNLMRETYYNKYGQQQYRIDYTGKPHVINGFRPTLPHIHVYDYKIVDNALVRIRNDVYPWN